MPSRKSIRFPLESVEYEVLRQINTHVLILERLTYKVTICKRLHRGIHVEWQQLKQEVLRVHKLLIPSWRNRWSRCNSISILHRKMQPTIWLKFADDTRSGAYNNVCISVFIELWKTLHSNLLKTLWWGR